MTFSELLESNGISPFLGDCFCVAGAIQKVIDKETSSTTILCVRDDPYGKIGHCMLENFQTGILYDADGEHLWNEAVDKFHEYTDTCYADENGSFEEECVDELSWDDKFMEKKLCDGKIARVEKIMLENQPNWLKKYIT